MKTMIMHTGVLAGCVADDWWLVVPEPLILCLCTPQHQPRTTTFATSYCVTKLLSRWCHQSPNIQLCEIRWIVIWVEVLKLDLYHEAGESATRGWLTFELFHLKIIMFFFLLYAEHDSERPSKLWWVPVETWPSGTSPFSGPSPRPSPGPGPRSPGSSCQRDSLHWGSELRPQPPSGNVQCLWCPGEKIFV